MCRSLPVITRNMEIGLELAHHSPFPGSPTMSGKEEPKINSSDGVLERLLRMGRLRWAPLPRPVDLTGGGPPAAP